MERDNLTEGPKLSDARPYTPAQWDQLDQEQEAKVAQAIREKRWLRAVWEYGALEWIRFARGRREGE